MKKIITASGMMLGMFLVAGSALAAYDFGPMTAKVDAGESKIADIDAQFDAKIAEMNEAGYDTGEASDLKTIADAIYDDLTADIDSFQAMLATGTDESYDEPSAEMIDMKADLKNEHDAWKAQLQAVADELHSLTADEG